MDKFTVGNRVICVAPHPAGERGYWGRKGTVVSQRQMFWTCIGPKNCYEVQFDCDPRPLGCIEWELLPDTLEGEKEVKRREEIEA